MKELCDFLETNKEVLHLDMSNNNIGFKDAIRISESLAKNHSIYGFHFIGNAGYIDSLGFLIPCENPSEESNENCVKLRIDGIRYTGQARRREVRDGKL